MRQPARANKAAVVLTDMYALKIPALWRALKQEHLSVWMLCIYFFFEYVRPQSLYPVLDVLPYGQIFLLLGIFTAFMDPDVKWVGNALNKLLVLFAIIVVLSGVFAFRPHVALDYWEIFGSWFLIYFVLITVANTERRLLLFLLAYCLFSLKMSQNGVIGWAQKGFSFTSFGIIGAPGWFRNSGEYAIQMLIYGSLSVSMVVALKPYMGKFARWFAIIAAATGYVAVMGASSRGAQLGLAAIAIWMLLKQKNGFKGLVWIIVIATALYYVLPDEQLNRFREMGDDLNSLQRLAYWEYGMTQVVPEFPVLGVGYSNWLAYMWFVEPAGIGPMQTIQAVHNIYVQAATETGITGLLVFLFLALFAFINNFQTRRMALQIDNRLCYFVSFGLDAGLIGFMVAGAFVTVLFYPFFWIQIAMIVAVNNVTRKLYNEKTGANLPKRRGPAMSYPVVDELSPPQTDRQS